MVLRRSSSECSESHVISWLRHGRSWAFKGVHSNAFNWAMPMWIHKGLGRSSSPPVIVVLGRPDSQDQDPYGSPPVQVQALFSGCLASSFAPAAPSHCECPMGQCPIIRISSSWVLAAEDENTIFVDASCLEQIQHGRLKASLCNHLDLDVMYLDFCMFLPQ